MKRARSAASNRLAWHLLSIAGVAVVGGMLFTSPAYAEPLLIFGSALAGGSAFGPNGIGLGTVEQSCSDPTCTVSVPAAPRFGSSFSGSAFADISPAALSISGHNTFGGAIFPPLENVDYSGGGSEAFYAHVAPDADVTIVLTTHFSSLAAGGTVGIHDVYLGSVRSANAFSTGDFEARYTLRVGSAINGPDGLPYYWVDTIKANAGAGLSGSTGLAQDAAFEGRVTIGIFDSAGNQLNVVSDVPEPPSSALLLAGLLLLASTVNRRLRFQAAGSAARIIR
jgi:hypothetical protein